MRSAWIVVWRLWRSMRNSARNFSVTERVRFGVILALGIAIIAMTYLGALRLLSFLDSQILFGYLTPAISLSLVLSVVSLFVFFSALSHMIGSLTQGVDSDFLYALPLNPAQLLGLRLTETAVSAGWTSVLLTLPVLAAVGLHAGGDPRIFLPCGALLLCLFFLAVSTLGAAAALALVRIFPPVVVNRYLGWAILAVLFGAVVLFLRSHGERNPVVDVIQYTSSVLLPSSWFGMMLGDLINGSTDGLAHFGAALGFVGFSLSGAIFLGEILLKRASSRALERSAARSKRTLLSRLTMGLADPLRGIYLRELALLFRSPSTLVHIIFLCALALGYAGMLSRLGLGSAPSLGDPRGWQMAYLGMNASIAGFITTALLSRLALPMTSLEGRAVWISLTSPVTQQHVLNLRRWLWCAPTCALTGGICCLGASHISADPLVSSASGAVGVLLGWCLTTLALACGARFARFDWNHPGELIASFGSIAFMLVSVIMTTVISIAFAVAATLTSTSTMLVLIALCAGSLAASEFLFRGSDRAIMEAAG